jgi:hypothetical protein
MTIFAKEVSNASAIACGVLSAAKTRGKVAAHVKHQSH